LALSLCGCAGVPKDLPAPLRAEIPDTCERQLANVPLPAIAPTDDARVAFLKDDAALITANGRITAGRECVVDLRRRYSSSGAVK
jgi:hypothetical protein